MTRVPLDLLIKLLRDRLQRLLARLDVFRRRNGR